MPSVPLRVAIVGSGPSGLYAVKALLNSPLPVSVDVFDWIPAPYGLVRYGVAPDHPKMRSVIRVLREAFTEDSVRFFGNVGYGVDLSHADLHEHYHAVVYATGTQDDRPLDIPGEDLTGSHSGRQFVNWYCGHPDTATQDFDLRVRAAAVVGGGNVALDLARMLARSAAEISATDVPDHVLHTLQGSEIDDIHVLVRRGAAHARFTPIELREMDKLAAADVCVRPDDLVVDADGQERMAANRQVRQNVEMLRTWSQREPEGKPRRVHLRFLRRPVRILGEDRVTGLVVERNEPSDGGRVSGTGRYETLDVGLVLRAVGYRADPLPGVAFDPLTGTIPHRSGRVLDDEGRLAPGDYVVGWAKRGPTGVIGTNKSDAAETVASLVEDAASLPPPVRPERDDLAKLLEGRQVRFTTWDGWLRLDAYEKDLGRVQDRDRVRIADRRVMLDVSGRQSP